MVLIAIGVIVLLAGWIAAGTFAYVNTSLQRDMDLQPDTRMVQFDEPSAEQLAEAARNRNDTERVDPPKPWEVPPSGEVLRAEIAGVSSNLGVRLKLSGGGVVTARLAGVEPRGDAEIAEASDGRFGSFGEWFEARLSGKRAGVQRVDECPGRWCVLLFRNGELINLKLLHMEMARPVPDEIPQELRERFRRATPGPAPRLATAGEPGTPPGLPGIESGEPGGTAESGSAPSTDGESTASETPASASDRELFGEQVSGAVSPGERGIDVSELSPEERRRLMRVRSVLRTVLERLRR